MKNEKDIIIAEKAVPHKRNRLLPTRLGKEASAPLFMLITAALAAAFVYYRMKYRRMMKEQPP